MEKIITQFYEAFKQKDSDTMASLYHENVVFEDPAFGVLKGKRASHMWKMLCLDKQKPLEVTYSNLRTEGDLVKVKWEAKYDFGPKNKKVHNKIDASFKFQDGKIIEHIDVFNLKTWSKQAVGFMGSLFGGTSFFKKGLNKKTNQLLDKFIAKQGE